MELWKRLNIRRDERALCQREWQIWFLLSHVQRREIFFACSLSLSPISNKHAPSLLHSPSLYRRFLSWLSISLSCLHTGLIQSKISRNDKTSKKKKEKKCKWSCLLSNVFYQRSGMSSIKLLLCYYAFFTHSHSLFSVNIELTPFANLFLPFFHSFSSSPFSLYLPLSLFLFLSLEKWRLSALA